MESKQQAGSLFSSVTESESIQELISNLGTRVQVRQLEHTTWFGPEKHHLAPLFEAILAGLVLEQPTRPRRYIYRCLLHIRALRARGIQNTEIRFDTFLGKNHPSKWPTHILLTEGREAHEALLAKWTREDEERERAARAVVAGFARTAKSSRMRDKEWERRALEGDTGPEEAQIPSISREATNLGAGALVNSLATPASGSFYLTQQSPQSSFD